MTTKFQNSIECAVVFCGGKGSRLGLIGKKKNKSLLLVKNKPIIYYIICQLLKSKIKKIILPLGFKGGDVKKYVKKNFNKDISKFIFVDTGINTKLSLRINKIKKFIPINGSTLLINGDTIFDFDLIKFNKSHIKSKKNISLAMFKIKIDMGLIQIKNNKPLKFKKSIFISNLSSNKDDFEAYAGLIFLKSTYLKKFRFNSKRDFELEMFNSSINSDNVNLFRIDKNICFPIDNIKNLDYANTQLKLID
jgi:glucose-1-phosphate cytidylyltransferase